MIIVKFTIYRKRSELFDERQTIRETPVDQLSCLSAGTLHHIWMSECLTRYNRAVVFATKDLKRNKTIAMDGVDKRRKDENKGYK